MADILNELWQSAAILVLWYHAFLRKNRDAL